MVDLFVSRWFVATGHRLDASALVHDSAPADRFDVPVSFPMPQARVGLARTIPEITGRERVAEVSDLYVQAIASAERFIYVESQYVTSCAVRDALIERMADASRPKLEVVLVMPDKPERFKEEMTVGVPQAAVLQTIDRAARELGHAFRIYNVVAGTGDEGEPVFVYIHSKLMIVDDRILIVGSANLTNRSMAIDSEVCAVYEARREDRELRNAIRRARVRLLLEHVGEDSADVRAIVRPEGLVARLDAMVESGEVRLRRYDMYKDEPSAVAKAVHELTLEFLDPWDGTNEKCPPAA
jgi:phosphatidylserine/phosphatidylglycerophosphate/cardiolipin synthase-like enzyme